MDMPFLLYLVSLMLRTLCIAALAGILTFKLRNVAARHAVWTAVLGSMLLMPVADIVLPAQFVPRPVKDVLLEQLPALDPVTTETLIEPEATEAVGPAFCRPARAPVETRAARVLPATNCMVTPQGIASCV